MREIKFRGKRADTGEWVYGDLIHTPELKNRIIGFIDTSSDGIADYEDFNFIVIPESVGQYTGLKDNHGNEIYESDILKGVYLLMTNNNYGGSVDVKCGGVVEFKDAQFSVWTTNTKAGFKRYKYFSQMHPMGPNQYEIEVIGNIHDNPELLNIKS